MNAGEPIKIQISHPQTNLVSQEVQLERHESKELKLSLPLKPAHLAVTSNPSGASVEVDGGAVRPTPTGRIRLEAGSHNVRISKNGFVDHEENVHLDGGEIKAIGPIELTTISERERIRRDEQEKQRKEAEERSRAEDEAQRQSQAEEDSRRSDEERRLKYSPYIIGGSINVAGATAPNAPTDSSSYGFGGYFGRRFDGSWGIVFGISLDVGGNSDTAIANVPGTTVYKLSGLAAQIGVPIFMGARGFYLKPLVGYSSHSVSGKITDLNGNVTPLNYQLSQIFEGVGVGYEFSFGREMVPIELEIVNYGGGGSYGGTVSAIGMIGLSFGF